MKTVQNLMMVVMVAIGAVGMAQTTYVGAPKQKIAVIDIDANGLAQNSELLGDIARLELQKKEGFQVLRKYDALEIFKSRESEYRNCYSSQCLARVGKELGAKQMLSGSAERFGERIVINLVLVDVATGDIVASDVNEYFNFGNEIGGMIEISINNLLGLENDPNLLNALERDDTALQDQVVEKLSLNGPRMGLAYATDGMGRRLSAPIDQGGYDAYPMMSQFGFQFEKQYMSAGDLQALVEFLPMISGLEQGMFIPSATLMNGFRLNKSGWEVAFGPSVSVNKVAIGYYDNREEGDGEWHLAQEWIETNDDGSLATNPNQLEGQLDKRGDLKITTKWVWAVGKTFKSGHLNVPVNAYIAPSKQGWLVGASFGFNLRKK